MLFDGHWLHIVLTEISDTCPILQFLFDCKLANLGVFFSGYFTLGTKFLFPAQRVTPIDRAAVSCAPGYLQCNFFFVVSRKFVQSAFCTKCRPPDIFLQ